MLVTSIFSFCHNVFYHSHHKFQFFYGQIYFVVCKCFELRKRNLFILLSYHAKSAVCKSSIFVTSFTIPGYHKATQDPRVQDWKNVCSELWEVRIYNCVDKKFKSTRCVCETLMPQKHPSFEKHDPDTDLCR